MAAPDAKPAARATDAALRQVLRAARPATACDAELAAAYAEGRLRGAERRRLESHLAECASCRSAATALLEERAPADPAPAPARLWWRWPWAVPALAGLLVVGSVVFYQREQVLRPASAPPAAQQVAKDEVAQLDKEVAAPAPPPPAAAPAATAAPEKSAESGRVSNLRSRPAAPPPNAPAAPAPLRANSEFRAQEAAAGAQDRRESAAAPAATAAPGGVYAGAPAVVGGVATVGAERDSLARQAEAAPAEEKTKAVALLARRADSPAPAPLPGGAPTRALARDGERLWAVSDGGLLFRSTDGGRTWNRLPSPTTADLVAVRWDPQARTLTVQDRAGREYRVEP